MRQKFYLFLLASLFFFGCNTGPADILIASRPSGAMVVMEGVEIGITPMQLKISKNSRIQVQMQGYMPYTEILSKGSEPNLLVKLERLPNSGLELVPEVDQAIENSSTPDTNIVLPPVAKPEPVKKVDPKRANSKRVSRTKKRLTIAQVKQNYRVGAISKYTYKQEIYRLKSEMDRALRQLKERYRRGDFDKIEYERRIRQTKYKYTG